MGYSGGAASGEALRNPCSCSSPIFIILLSVDVTSSETQGQIVGSSESLQDQQEEHLLTLVLRTCSTPDLAREFFVPSRLPTPGSPRMFARVIGGIKCSCLSGPPLVFEVGGDIQK